MLAAAARPGIAVLTDPAGPVKVVAFSQDGKTLASSGDGTIRLWDVTTRQQIGNPFADPGVVNSLAFSPDGKTVASGEGGASQSGTVRLSPASGMGPAARHDLGTTWPGYVSIMVWPGRCRQLEAGRGAGGGGRSRLRR